MKRYLDLNDRAFNAIQNKTKRVEIRANNENNDYSKYEMTFFDGDHKMQRRKDEFPQELQRAYELGKRLVING